MVAPPPSDVRWLTGDEAVGTRHPADITLTRFSCELARRNVREIEYAMYEDPERADGLVLVVGNPTPEAVDATFEIDAADYARLTGDFVVLEESEDGHVRGVGTSVTVSVEGYAMRVLHIRDGA